MAGDWIKMRSNLWHAPKVAQLCDMTEEREATVIGGLYWLWATADQHTEDGYMQGLSVAGIDRMTGIKGFGRALIVVGWIVDTEGGITLTRFDEHNGASAKKRCQTAKRVANHSANNAPANAPLTQQNENTNADSVSGALAREEKRREDTGIPRAKALSSTALSPPLPAAAPPSVDLSPAAQAPPPCPHQKILTLFAQHLRMLAQPRPELWADSAGAADLRQRWRWVLIAKKTDGTRYAETEAQALDWFSRFFAYTADSDFLTGRGPSSPGKKAFTCTLQWLVKRANFEKVLQGNYANSANTP